MTCETTKRGTQRGCPHPTYSMVRSTLWTLGLTADQIDVNIQLAQAPEYWERQSRKEASA